MKIFPLIERHLMRTKIWPLERGLEFRTSVGNGAGRRMPGGHLGRGEEAGTEAYLGYQGNPDSRLWT